MYSILYFINGITVSTELNYDPVSIMFFHESITYLIWVDYVRDHARTMVTSGFLVNVQVVGNYCR